MFSLEWSEELEIERSWNTYKDQWLSFAPAEDNVLFACAVGYRAGWLTFSNADFGLSISGHAYIRYSSVIIKVPVWSFQYL